MREQPSFLGKIFRVETTPFKQVEVTHKARSRVLKVEENAAQQVYEKSLDSADDEYRQTRFMKYKDAQYAREQAEKAPLLGARELVVFQYPIRLPQRFDKRYS